MSRIIGAHKRALIASPNIGHLALYGNANTLTNLFPQLFAALNVVSRELVGFIPSAMRNTGAERAAVGQDVVYSVANAMAAYDIQPAMTVPEPPDQIVGNGIIKITKSRAVPFGWTGEEQRALNTGAGVLSVQGQWFAEALRTLCNEIETDGAIEAAANASRAYGTAGTTPFASTVGDSAQIKKILDDNGAPASGRSLVIDTTAGAALGSLPNLTRVNEAGTTMTLRDGELLNQHGLSIKQSAGVQTVVAGTAAGATTNGAGYAKGATSITLASAGTGTIPAGSTITFAGDVNKYQVVTGDASTADGGTIVIAAPGLRQAIPASATAITMIATHTANIGFSQNALHIVARKPALPEGGDIAIDSMEITDVRSGLVFEIRMYAGYRKIRLEVGLAWGWKAVKREHIAMLLG